jgi:hypothetical protein
MMNELNGLNFQELNCRQKVDDTCSSHLDALEQQKNENLMQQNLLSLARLKD